MALPQHLKRGENTSWNGAMQQFQSLCISSPVQNVTVLQFFPAK